MAEIKWDPPSNPPTFANSPAGMVGTRYAKIYDVSIRKGTVSSAWLATEAASILEDNGGMPGVDSWPGMRSLPVHSYSITALDESTPDGFLATVTYQLPDVSTETINPDPDAPAQIEIGATIQTRRTVWELETVSDIVPVAAPDALKSPGAKVQQIKIAYTPKKGTADAGIEDIQSGTIEEQVVQPVLKFTRRYGGSQGLLIRNLANYYVGTVNSKTFGDDTDMINQWMCTSILGTSNDGGVNYDVTIEFQRNLDLQPGTNEVVTGWRPLVHYIKDNGDTPEDLLDPASNPNGWKRVTPTGLVAKDFGNLNLT